MCSGGENDILYLFKSNKICKVESSNSSYEINAENITMKGYPSERPYLNSIDVVDLDIYKTLVVKYSSFSATGGGIQIGFATSKLVEPGTNYTNNGIVWTQGDIGFVRGCKLSESGKKHFVWTNATNTNLNFVIEEIYLTK